MAPQFPNRSNLHAKKALFIINHCQATREAPAAVLRTHSIDLQEAEDFSVARYLWRPNVYGRVMLHASRYSQGETLKFCEPVGDASAGQRFISSSGRHGAYQRTWLGEITVDDGPRGRWAEMVKRFVAAAQKLFAPEHRLNDKPLLQETGSSTGSRSKWR